MKNTPKKSIFGWIFLCCWMTYMTAYLCRVNFSSAMPAITGERGYDEGMLGIIGAVYYGAYACGQLVSGYFSDRIRAHRFILTALAGTMLCNIGMAFFSAFPLMLILWGLNGCFQSMFWCTIIRVLAQNIPASRRAAISSAISMGMPIAYIISWGVLGRLLDGAAVKWYFLIPSFVCIPLMAGWLLLSGKMNREVSSEKKNGQGIRHLAGFVRKEHLLPMMLVCLLHGLVKEGAAYWMPLLLSGMEGQLAISPYLAVCIMPAVNFLGVIVSRVMLEKQGKRPLLILIVLLVSVSFLCIGLLLNSNGLFMVGLTALISGCCYASNNLLMGFIPMQYTGQNMVASVIGLFDFSAYVGAAISTYVLGKLLSSAGFAPLPGIWLAASLIPIVLLALMMKKQKAAE